MPISSAAAHGVRWGGPGAPGHTGEALLLQFHIAGLTGASGPPLAAMPARLEREREVANAATAPGKEGPR